MKKLRVLSLSTLYPHDGAPNFGVFVERQMQAVTRRGDVDLTVVSGRGLPPFPLDRHARYRPLAALPEREDRGGVRVLRPRFTILPKIGAGRNAAALAQAVLPLARRLHAEAAFDLIDAQFFHPDGAAALTVARALDLPLSIKARGADVHHWGQDPGTAAQVREAARAADGLLAVSEGLADDLAALGAARDRITVHRTGLETDLFRPYDPKICRDSLNLPRDVPVLACVGALIERKGQALVMEALAMLDRQAVLLLAGTGPDEAALRAQAARLGLGERVRFLGGVPHGDLPVLLNAADLMVLPSASEGLANAWVEALACGTPVITSDLPGARELITRPEYGRLVQREAQAIAAAAREVLTAPSDRETVRQAVAGMSWDANAAALVEHWRGLAAKA